MGLPERPRRLTTVLIAGLALLAAGGGAATPARAQDLAQDRAQAAQRFAAACRPDPDLLGSAPRVLLGTVVDTQGGFARLQVSEIWRGSAVAPLVWVGSDGSDDLGLSRGERYLVGLTAGFEADTCQVFRADDPVLAAARPRQVSRPVPAGSRGADRPITALRVVGWSLAGLALLSLLGVGLYSRPSQLPRRLPG